MLNIIKTAKTVTDRQLKADTKAGLMNAMILHTANEIVSSAISQEIGTHVLTVAIKAMNVGADASALESSVQQALDMAIADVTIADNDDQEDAVAA